MILCEISQHEKFCIASIFVAFLLLISVPYFWAWYHAPTGFEFSGLLVVVNDQNVHLAWAKQAQEGHFFFRNLYSNDLQLQQTPPLFTHLLSWVIGTVSRYTGFSLILVYHGFRALCATLTLLWFYGLSREVTNDERTRIIAVGLVALSGGGGWVLSLLPLELANRLNLMDDPGYLAPEAFTFISAFTFTTNIASMALLALIYKLILQAGRSKSLTCVAIASIAAFVLGNIHTYDVVPLIVIIAIWTTLDWHNYHKHSLTKRESLFHPALLLLVIVGAALPALAQYVVLLNNDDFQQKASIKIPAREPLSLFMSYLPLSVFAVLGALRYRQNRTVRLLLTWVGVTSVLIYSPISFAAKMIEGLHLPLCLLGALGIARVSISMQHSRYGYFAFACILVTLFLSTPNFLHRVLVDAQRDSEKYFDFENFTHSPHYISDGDVAAMEFLDIITPSRQKTVLSFPFIGNYIPQQTGQYAYVGHWAETVNYMRDGGKLDQTMIFYLGKLSNQEALKWLRTNRIDYVFEGFYEKLLAKRLNSDLPSQKYSLSRVYNSNGTDIYAVSQP